jgi:hypothetical protein
MGFARLGTSARWGSARVAYLGERKALKYVLTFFYLEERYIRVTTSR